MRITAALPLILVLGACQVSKDDANDSVSVTYNEDVAENAAADVGNFAENVGGAIANDVERTGRQGPEQRRRRRRRHQRPDQQSVRISQSGRPRTSGMRLNGRGDRIRTCDPLLPKQMRYQAAPLPDDRWP